MLIQRDIKFPVSIPDSAASRKYTDSSSLSADVALNIVSKISVFPTSYFLLAKSKDRFTIIDISRAG